MPFIIPQSQMWCLQILLNQQMVQYTKNIYSFLMIQYAVWQREASNPHTWEPGEPTIFLAIFAYYNVSSKKIVDQVPN